MTKTIIWLVLRDLGPDALKAALAFVVAIVVALAFTIASLITLFESAAPGSVAFLGSGIPGVGVPAGGGQIGGPSGGGAPGGQQPRPGAAGDRIVELALAQIGVPYVWGGGSPRSGFDCSGLVQWVYRESGLSLPRTAQQQFDVTTRVPRSSLRPGDLVFYARTDPSQADWITHVGIYIGNGLMVNAPSEGQAVQVMSAFNGFWGTHYAGAGRL